MAKDAIPSMILEVTDRRPSNWIKEGGVEGEAVIRRDTAEDWIPKTTSSVKVMNKDGTYSLRKTRFIFGCETIFVDEQEAKGIKPNPGFDRNELIFKDGKKMVVRNGRDIGLYDYLKFYEANGDNQLRPEGAVVKFIEVRTSVIAIASVETFDAELQANQYLGSLKATDSRDKVTYKERELEFLCGLFRVPHLETPAEKFAALWGIVKLDPDSFNRTIANKKSSMISEVNQAIQLGVIALDATKAMLVNGEKVLTTFKTRNTEEQIEELAVFFFTPAGEMLYKQFSIELRAAKEMVVAMET